MSLQSLSCQSPQVPNLQTPQVPPSSQHQPRHRLNTNELERDTFASNLEGPNDFEDTAPLGPLVDLPPPQILLQSVL